MLCRISLSQVWNSTIESGLFAQAVSKLASKQNKFRCCHSRGVFDEDSDTTPKFNRRGGYIEPPTTPRSGYGSVGARRNTYSRQYNQRRNFDESSDQSDDDISHKQRNQYPSSRNKFNFEFDQRSYSNRSYNNENRFGDFRQSDRAPRYPQNATREPITLSKASFDLETLSEIRKNLYVEHPNVASRSEDDIEKYRQSLNINVKGTDIPRPISQFNELCLPEKLMKVVEMQGFNSPTPIQAQGWPIAMSGRDMIGISQTGSGKTLVFMLPAVIHATNQKYFEENSFSTCKPQVLVLAPTRELVQQIQQVSSKFITSCGLSSSCAYGGASKSVQLRFLRGANICVATPGRLIDFVSEGTVNLENCTYLVLDEADRMLDMGFEPQIRQIVDQIRPDRQTLMWSATWPKDIRNLAEEFLNDYIKVTVGTEELAANPNIQQNIYVVDESEKKEKLLSLINDIKTDAESKTLIFAQTKKMVDVLGYFLNDNGVRALCIHGDVSQFKRDAVLKRFREQKSCVLIATDVAARGLDITDIQHVVNYDFPPNMEDYIHRIGRTARGTNSGFAHSFFTSENLNVARELISTLQETQQTINPKLYSLMENYRRPRKQNRYAPNRRNFERDYAF